MTDAGVQCFHINPNMGYRCINPAIATWRMPGDVDGTDSGWLADRVMTVPLCERHGLMLGMDPENDSA